MIFIPSMPLWVVYTIFFIEFFIASFFVFSFIQTKFMKKTLPAEKPDFDITFVIPAYNKGRLLESCVKSIKNFDYNQSKIKIIIVDDKSTDNTLEIARQLEKKYSNLKVYAKPKNSGKADTLNFGIKRSNTQLIAVLDADTFPQPDMLKKAFPEFLNSNIMAVACRFKPSNHSRIIERMQYVEYFLTGFYRSIMSKIRALPVAPAFTIFRREFFIKHGGFDTGNLTEDFEMGLRIQSKQNNIGYVADSYAMTDVPDTLGKFIRQRIRWGYGTLYNCRKYIKLFFNPKYGDLAFFILPTWLFGTLLVSAVLLFTLYLLFAEIVNFAIKISAGWIPYITFNMTKIILFFTDLRTLLIIFSLLIGLSLFLFIRVEFKEKIKLKDYILYIFLYIWIQAVATTIAVAYFIIGKKPEW